MVDSLKISECLINLHIFIALFFCARIKEIIFVNKIFSDIKGHQYLCNAVHDIIIVLHQ